MGFLRYQYLFVIATFSPSSPCMAQGEEGMEYERNSMHVMMIKHLNQRYDDIIEDVFLQTPFPERFNNHNLGVKTVSFAELDGDQSGNIMSFIDQVNLGQKMVSKWFSRDKRTGSFNMALFWVILSKTKRHEETPFHCAHHFVHQLHQGK